jgi:hypothetical protein
MRRKVLNGLVKKENRKIDRFIVDMIKLYKKHGFSLSLKTKKDEFIVTKLEDDHIELLKQAIDGTTEEK